MDILRKLLGRLSSSWNTVSKDVPTLVLAQGTGTYGKVTIKQGSLHLHSAPYRNDLPQMATVVLDGLSVNDLISQLNSMGYTASLASEGSSYSLQLRNATVLMDVANVPLTATLNGFTSVTWQVFYPLYRALQDASNDTDEAIRQLSLTTTSGSWLDYWASFFTLHRYAGETDNNFVKRVLMWIFNPKTNNLAIKELIAYRLGVTPDRVTLNDVSPAKFEVLVDDTLVNAGNDVDLYQILQDARGAGIDGFLNYVKNGNFNEDYEAYLASVIGRPFNQMDVVSAVQWSNRIYSENKSLPSEAGREMQVGGFSEAKQMPYSNYDTCFSMDESSLDTDAFHDGSTPACAGYMTLSKTDGTVLMLRDL